MVVYQNPNKRRLLLWAFVCTVVVVGGLFAALTFAVFLQNDDPNPTVAGAVAQDEFHQNDNAGSLPEQSTDKTLSTTRVGDAADTTTPEADPKDERTSEEQYDSNPSDQTGDQIDVSDPAEDPSTETPPDKEEEVAAEDSVVVEDQVDETTDPSNPTDAESDGAVEDKDTSDPDDNGSAVEESSGGEGVDTNKWEWPELVGKTGEEAKQIIQAENPSMTEVEIYNEFEFFSMDYKEDRVRVIVDENGIVVETPMVG